MSKEFDPAEIEAKWQKKWAEAKLFNVDLHKAENPFYNLVMFPYPSGDKLHVGHWYNFAPADSFGRYMKMKGFDVFEPMGFDAFGLPAENYAIKTGVHPTKSIAENVQTMIKQLSRIGTMYDWDKTVNTSAPEYYKWTQWLFLEMFKHGLAYKKTATVNWCPKDQTVLANEQVDDGKCERCGTEVIQKPLEQWFWKITNYAQKLLDNLETLDWPEKTKLMQKNWIGRSEGAEIDFDVDQSRGVIGPINWPIQKDPVAADSNRQLTDQSHAVATDSNHLTQDGSKHAALAGDLKITNESHAVATDSNHLTQDGSKHAALAADFNRRLTDKWKRRIYSPVRTVHLIFTPHSRSRIFEDVSYAVRILRILESIADKHSVIIHDAVAMPDHVHLLVSFDAARHLENDVVKKLKGASARAFLAEFEFEDAHLWGQKKHFVDVTSFDQFLSVLRYIHKNPDEERLNSKDRTLSKLSLQIRVFTTRPDTIFGVTYMVIAPEHPFLDLITTNAQKNAVDAYRDQSTRKTELQRKDLDVIKTGEFTGAYALSPVTSEKIPIWIADYVLMTYGTGAIMAVPAHDERDHLFAKKYKIEIKEVVSGAEETQLGAYIADGITKNSDFLNGLKTSEAKSKVIEWIENKRKGNRTVNYRLRDWLVSRQRYWGAPIPIVYDPDGTAHPIPKEHLPWLLPADVEFSPTGESPLRASKELKERTEKLFGKGWTPEYDTMDTFVCSSFYYLRYLADQNSDTLIDPAIEKKWMPVNMYIGGPEHATMHLIYARFVMMALKDFGYVAHDEPFKRLVHQGLITNQGAKMSKSKGNVVSPDEFIERHGSDVFRMYLMFMGPFTDGGDWNDTGIKGIDRFVMRVHRMYLLNKNIDQDSAQIEGLIHKTIKKVTEMIERLQFNTAISSLMELLNDLEKQEGVSLEAKKIFALLLAPLAPHLAEELWAMLGETGFVIAQSWPTYDCKKIVEETVTIVVQVNGKVRGEYYASPDITESDAIDLAKANDNVRKFLDGKEPKKAIFIKAKLVSLVV